MLIRQLRVDALLVRGKLPGANAVVETYTVNDLQRAYVGDGHLKGIARRLSQRRSASLAWQCPERANAGVVEPATISGDFVVVRIDASHQMTRNLAGGRRNLVDPIVHERRHEQALPVPRERHVVGTAGVQRALPKEAATRNVERRD